MVVGALNVDRAWKAAPPFGHVIGDIRHEVRVRALALAHDAILVVAVVGGAEPERAFMPVRLSLRLEYDDGFIDHPVGIERRLEIVRVESHTERLEVQILFLSELGDGKSRQVFQEHLGRRCAADFGGFDGCQQLLRALVPHSQIAFGYFANVLSVIATLGNRRFPAGDLSHVREHRRTEVGDLHPGVVVVELARHLPPGPLEQRGDGVT